MGTSKVCLLAVFCTLIILTTFSGCAQSASCCLMYTRRRQLPYTRLLGYTIQNINTSCDINAIIFHLPGRFLCADPSVDSTRKGMAYVDEMRKRKGQITKETIAGHQISIN
ncbi:C-C motif chemokine 20-like [Seriola lalandi dorsalis]|uniref:C-C motif chemokine n=1 Tax=Seriola lalandi dorsalis TaxID=1841481 RepID=A0A3B4YXJ7_SERLL|nr:C-C motif chemokine 20-like [Seriola lalandi dorsalis]XP_056220480.1 C-C motif chemokine 20-like [Seriola aureovittata]